MYSVLLVAALSTGGDAANCHGRHGDGCGCYGGGHGGGSGCYGWYNGGCYGSCYGCYGSHGFAYGCSGCWGGCYGSGCWGGCCGGCWGGCWGGCSGCYGCYGGASQYYAPGSYGPGTIVPTEPSMQPPVMPPVKQDTLPQPKPTSSRLLGPDRARLLVDLPADAKLYIDDQLMRTTSDHRTFNTPRLDGTQTYYYELRAEVVRDGKPVTMTKRVTLRAGDVIRARFGEMDPAETISTVNAR
jgi:uncharacterized protein (TIGR03000 family)